MRVWTALVLWLLVASGCLGPETPQDGETPPATNDGTPANLTLYLKSGHRLSPEAPAKSTPDRVDANPMANGFANEDLKAFASPPMTRPLNITRARLVVYYEVAAHTVDPFPNASNPMQARQIVFWVGSRGIYPASVSTSGDTFLLPGRVYRAEADIPLPQPGWFVLPQEPIQLLVATLAVNDRGAELRFLVDSPETPSRLELTATTSEIAAPVTLHTSSKDAEIAGNSGMFTGATADRVPSRLRVPVEVRANDTFLEVRIVFRSNAGGKSDLDFDLFAPDGGVAAVSSTPFQSETVRLFAPNLAVFGPGTYQAEIVAYSGTNTKFSVETAFASPR